MTWTPHGTELTIAAVPDAHPPAETATGRLQQMRQFARRFGVHEEYRKDKVECRLLPSPLDRYADPDKGIVDGAMFAFANGTNPELGLFLECNDKDWTYGTFRMGAAALSVDLDGKRIREIAPVQIYTTSGFLYVDAPDSAAAGMRPLVLTLSESERADRRSPSSLFVPFRDVMPLWQNESKPPRQVRL